ncbi:MAG: GGDEF domain-containing protein [Mycobacterium sp.]
MSEDWLLAVDLGSLAMAGIGLLFVVIWAIDRSHACAAAFAGAIGCYIAGTLTLSVPASAALASSIHGVLFPVAMVLLADGLLRRVADRLPRRTMVGYLVAMIVIVWYFAYGTPLLVGRIVTQNLGTALLLSSVARRLWLRAPKTGPDRAALIATVTLATALGIDVVAAQFSTVPRELATPAAMDSYMHSHLELCLIVSSTVVLPACMIALLAVTVIDMARELRLQRDCDELTGLLNRRGFNRRAEATLRTTEHSTLILADLDYFKAVNDTLGHSSGDKVLIVFARILLDSAGPGQIVGRIGGEEFAVLLPHTGLESAVEWAESARIRMASQPVELRGEITTVTASFGITAGNSGSQLIVVLDAADKALYKAKVGGRNRISVGQ